MPQQKKNYFKSTKKIWVDAIQARLLSHNMDETLWDMNT